MKNKKSIFISVGTVLILGVLLIFGKDTFINNIYYHEQKEQILDYVKEQYNITPKVISIIKTVEVENETHKYAYYICMNYDGNDFTAYIYEDGEITDDYISLKLGIEIYDEVVNNIESKLNTEVLKLDDWNRIYLNYSEETSLSLDMTVDKLLNQIDKKTELSLILVLKNNDLSDLEFVNKVSDFINNYVKEKGIDYLTVSFDLIESKNIKTVEKEQSTNGYVKRYVNFSNLDVSDFSIEDLKSSIETTIDYNNYTKPLINE